MGFGLYMQWLNIHSFIHMLHLRCGQLHLMHILLYRVSRGECARLQENVPQVKVHRFNQKHLYSKLNGYGDNGERSLKV